MCLLCIEAKHGISLYLIKLSVHASIATIQAGHVIPVDVHGYLMYKKQSCCCDFQ
jgi:hypothetical protein